jgi:hypothetical protein
MSGHPFRPGEWSTIGELRRVAAEIHRARRADPAPSAMMRAQSEKWAKEWTEELYPLSVLADHKAFSNADKFCWTPDDAADFTLRLGHGGTIKVQNTMAFAEWPDSIGKQGGHLHKLEMYNLTKRALRTLAVV